METQEIWKDIPGYEGMYQVSNLGNVKSLDRIIKQLHFGEIKEMNYKGRMLIRDVDKRNHTSYLSVRLSKGNKIKKYSVHRLVGYVFLGLDINNPQIHICHKDDNGLNNTLDNLFLGDKYINMNDMIKKGRGVDNSGENNGMSKLDKETVLNFLKHKDIYINNIKERKELANTLGVTARCILDICKGRRWKKYYY